VATPLAVVVALLVGALVSFEGPGLSFMFPSFLLAILAGIVVSIVALARIGGRPDLKGTGFAVTGIVLPVAILVLAVPLLLMARAEPEEGPVVERHTAPGPMTRDLQAHIRRLEELSGGMASVDELAKLVDPAARQRFRDMASDEWRRLYEEERLGLPMIAIDELPAPLSEYLIVRTVAQGNRGSATLVHDRSALRFPMVFADGRWYFGIGKVERIPWPE
jgi:hypothetical protein